MQKVAYSLVMSTLGRFEEPLQFIGEIAKCESPTFELIIVDQNESGRLRDAVSALQFAFPIKYLHCPGDRGLSRGRNMGLKEAVGDIICFPDDDCTYPSWLLKKVETIFGEKNVDIVCGRAADEVGRDINGRFLATAQYVNRKNVFNTQIEWVVFFKKGILEAVGGYDENIGVGSPTPWQANEGQDVTLRALKRGCTAYYSPDIFGFHPELDVCTPDKKMIQKARDYARGMGFVLGKFDYRIHEFLYYFIRSVGGALYFLLRGNVRRALYYVVVAVGRLEGYLAGLQCPRNTQ
jgi:glycosyltransferase involved in cell wall biosynthesis